MNFIVENGKINLKQTYFQRVDQWINKSDDGELSRQEEIALQLSQEFEMFSMQGKVTFGFKYTDNKENRLRGRVGKYSGWRTGTRDFSMMPDNKIPKKILMEQTCVRYYDFGRMNWRSFKKTLFVVCSSFFNKQDGKWYDNPEDAGFKRTWKNKNKLKMRKDRPDTEDEKTKRIAIEKKEKEKRDRQIFIQSQKTMKKAQQYYALTSRLNIFKSQAIETPPIILKGCLMLNFSCDNWLDILSLIDPEDLYQNTQGNFGLEFDPHCTILYGFDNDKLNIDELKEYTRHYFDNNYPDYRVMSISYFESQDYDVLKYRIISQQFTDFNHNLRQLFEYENKWDYNPHVTVAYLKKGVVEKYMNLQLPDLSPQNIVYSKPDKIKTKFMTFRSDFKD